MTQKLRFRQNNAQTKTLLDNFSKFSTKCLSLLLTSSALLMIAFLYGCGIENKNEEHRPSKLIERLPLLTTVCSGSSETGQSQQGEEGLSDEEKAEIENALEKKGILRAASYVRTHEGDIFVVGGFDGENESDRTWFWNEEKRTLKEGPRMVEARSFSNAYQMKDGRLLVSGGRGGLGVGRLLDSVEISKPNAHQFSHLCDLYFPRMDHSVTQFSDHELFVSGGKTDEENADHDNLTSSIEVIDLDGPKRIILGKLRQTRFGHHTYVSGNDLIVAGGYSGYYSLYPSDSDVKPLRIDEAEKCSIEVIRERFKKVMADR